MEKVVRFDVISPDGFSIDRILTYKTKIKAKNALKKWMKRYESQGYYSSNRGRIALEDLADNCRIIELN